MVGGKREERKRKDILKWKSIYTLFQRRRKQKKWMKRKKMNGWKMENFK